MNIARRIEKLAGDSCWKKVPWIKGSLADELIKMNRCVIDDWVLIESDPNILRCLYIDKEIQRFIFKNQMKPVWLLYTYLIFDCSYSYNYSQSQQTRIRISISERGRTFLNKKFAAINWKTYRTLQNSSVGSRLTYGREEKTGLSLCALRYLHDHWRCQP